MPGDAVNHRHNIGAHEREQVVQGDRVVQPIHRADCPYNDFCFRIFLPNHRNRPPDEFYVVCDFYFLGTGTSVRLVPNLKFLDTSSKVLYDESHVVKVALDFSLYFETPAAQFPSADLVFLVPEGHYISDGDAVVDDLINPRIVSWVDGELI